MISRHATRPFLPSRARAFPGTQTKWAARLFAHALAASLALSLASSASAQDANPTTSREQARAMAESLFEQGRTLMAAGKYDEACPKLAESHRLDPAGGTALNVAVCFEKQGKTASAWTAFKEALAFAIKDGRESRERTAREHIAALEPKLNRIVLAPKADAKVPGLTIRLDGVDIKPVLWGTPTPVDPGAHAVQASANGYHTWEQTVDIDRTSDVVAVEIPTLVKKPPEAHQDKLGDIPSRREEPPSMTPGRRTAIIVSFGAAAVGVATGSLFGALAIARRSDSNQLCTRGDSACEPEGVRLNERAMDYSWVSTVAFGVGLASAAVGLVLLIKKPSQPAAKPPAVGLSVGPGQMWLTQSW